MINSLSRRFIKILDFIWSSFFSGVPGFPLYLIAKLHPIIARLQSYSFHPSILLDHSFLPEFFMEDQLGGSSRILLILQDFLSKLRSAKLYSQINMVFNICLVLRSSSILHLAFQSAILSYLIIWGGVMSLLIISLRFSWFTSFQEWHILNPSFSVHSGHLFNPSISSLELSWVIFHLKRSLRTVAIYGGYKRPKFFIYPFGEISFSSPCCYQSNLLFR